MGGYAYLTTTKQESNDSRNFIGNNVGISAGKLFA